MSLIFMGNFSKKIISEYPDNTCVWHSICSVSRRLLPTTALMLLKIPMKRLDKETKFEYAWSCLTILTKKLGADLPTDVLEFLNDILSHDGENCSAWQYRYELVMMRILSLSDEVEYTRMFLIENRRNFYAWRHRRRLFDRVESLPPEQEIALTESILSKDAENVYAWHHKQWLLHEFGQWEVELDYCRDKVNNKNAWNQRSFVMRLCFDKSIPERKCEVECATSAIRQNPRNRCAWLYLQSLYQSHFDVDVEAILEEVLLREVSGHLIMDIAKNSIKYFHVVETFRYVMWHGYRPSDKMNAVIASLCAEYKLGVGGISVFLYSISSVLLFLCPNSMLQCEWNMGKLPALTTYSNLEGVLQDLNEELEEELRNRRRKLAKKLGIDAETKLHNTELATELKFWDEPLQLKIFNGPAWDQRLNVVIKYKMKMEDKVRHGQLEDEVREAKERISKVLKDEVCYAKECILKNLENKHAWLYLKSLYTLIRADKMDPIFRDCSLDDLFKSIFEDQNLLPKNIASLTRLIDHEFDIVKNERKLLCSLDALLHLLSFGYKPAIRVQFAVKRLNPPMQGGGTLLRCIYLVLALLQPLRAHHWKWLMEQVCSQRPPLSYL